MSNLVGVPGTTKMIRFEVRDPRTLELVNPAGGVVISYAHLDADVQTEVDPGDVDNSETGVFIVGIPCASAGGYGCTLEALGEFVGRYEEYWQIPDSLLPPLP
jgi:hypothetical protein